MPNTDPPFAKLGKPYDPKSDLLNGPAPAPVDDGNRGTHGAYSDKIKIDPYGGRFGPLKSGSSPVKTA